MDSFPPTIIVVHPRERRTKCTVEALRNRPDCVFWDYPQRGLESLDGYARLDFGGPVVSPADAAKGLLVLDGTWRRADKMRTHFAELPVRSLPPLATAYPRVSKVYPDPALGLATVEAIYAAYALMGRSTAGLLDHYRWRDKFLERNRGSL